MTSSNKLGGINGVGPDGLTKPARDHFLKLINVAHKEVLAAESRGLDSVITAGNWLHSVKAQIDIPMQEWMARYMPEIGVSTYKMYLQLTVSKNYAVIMAARETDPHLSINAARKLLVKKKLKGDNPKGKKSFKGWSDDEIRDALLELEFDHFRRVIPEWYRTQLLGHSRAQILRVAQAQPPRTKLKDFVPRLVAGTDLEELPPTQH